MNLSHRKLLERTRDTKKTLYVVAAAYVGVGFVLAVACLATGQLLGTFLGFLIISGTLAAASVLRAVLRVGVRVSAITDRLDDIARRLDRVETSIEALSTRHSVQNETGPKLESAAAAESESASGSELESAGGVVDLAGAGGVDAAAITAATLDRDVFPRLVSLLERDGISGPRSAFRETAGVGVHAELDEATRRMERSLRRAFTDCVARRDLAGLLDVTERVLEHLPDHPMAGECRRLQDPLRQALSDNGAGDDNEANDDADTIEDAPPSLRVAQATT